MKKHIIALLLLFAPMQANNQLVIEPKKKKRSLIKRDLGNINGQLVKETNKTIQVLNTIQWDAIQALESLMEQEQTSFYACADNIALQEEAMVRSTMLHDMEEFCKKTQTNISRLQKIRTKK